MKRSRFILHLALTGVLCGCPASFSAPADSLRQADLAWIGEVQETTKSVSRQFGLVNTIERLLDCSSSGRIEVALIGQNTVPAWVLETWKRQEPEVTEVSISRYSMALDARNPGQRTDFYRFRAIRPDGRIIETLYQDDRKDKKAPRIYTFVDGDPFGPNQRLQEVLVALLSVVEEGLIRVETVPYVEAPLRLVTIWKNCAGPDGDGRIPLVEKFTLETAGGEEIEWRLSVSDSQSGFFQTVLVAGKEMIYNNRNGKIETR